MSDDSKLCPGCQVENDASHAFCYKCGTSLTAHPMEIGSQPAVPPAPGGPVSGFSWRWVGWSVLIILGTSIVVGLSIGFLYGLVGGRDIPPALAFVTGGLGIFLGGLIAGYQSPGVTIKEPAVAAALVSLFFVLMNKQYSAVLLGWLMPFGLAYLGAWLGEKIQGTI